MAQGGGMAQAGVLTVSDGCARGEREDVSGRVLAETLEANGYAITQRGIAPDETPIIADTLRRWCEAGCDLIITTGGTGFAPRDITPEATRLDYRARRARPGRNAALDGLPEVSARRRCRGAWRAFGAEP